MTVFNKWKKPQEKYVRNCTFLKVLRYVCTYACMYVYLIINADQDISIFHRNLFLLPFFAIFMKSNITHTF